MLVAGSGNANNTVEVLVVFSQKIEEEEVPVIFTCLQQMKDQGGRKVVDSELVLRGIFGARYALCSQFLPSFFFSGFYFFLGWGSTKKVEDGFGLRGCWSRGLGGGIWGLGFFERWVGSWYC